MGKLSVTIDDKLEKELRVVIAQKGRKHGDLKVTIEDNIKLWLKQEKKAAAQGGVRCRTNG
ncbi:MAG: hypothetical protein OIN66_10635 [Candidatus Methanoperedens sp.]|nr:hypothetical protein [Candidatus Methanoperedens sp.]